MANRIKDGGTTIGAVVQIPKKTHKAIKAMAENKQEETNKKPIIRQCNLVNLHIVKE